MGRHKNANCVWNDMTKKSNNSKAMKYAAIALVLIVGGVILQKLLAFIGLILLGVAGYFLLKKKR